MPQVDEEVRTPAMLRLTEILTMRGVPLNDYKIHLATYRPQDGPMEAFHNDAFKKWQEEQQGKNFECETIVGLIQMGGDRWLFAGAYRVLGVSKGTTTRWLYSTELLPGQGDLIGRIIVKFNRNFRQSYVLGSRYGEKLEVVRILEHRYSVQDFPGYNQVCISFDILRLITQRDEPAWKSALSSVNGVYLIMDEATGKGYVGSAYARGLGGIWQRWCEYAATGHGGNHELKDLLKKKGEAYAAHFKFAILEIADPQLPNDYVHERENHWKSVLMTRIFGYNRN